MKAWVRILIAWFGILGTLGASQLGVAQDAGFHDAPASAQRLKNPYGNEAEAADAGNQLFAAKCAGCHGPQAQGTAIAPALATSRVQAIPEGEIFWYITKGDARNGMPAWAILSQQQRWQLVTFVKSITSSTKFAEPPPDDSVGHVISGAPAPPPPFTDYRFEKPGNIHKITLNDLPRPYATKSADNESHLVPRPPNAWPKAPDEFKVQQYATGLHNPRSIRTAPNGDLFVAETDAGQIRVLRGINADGKAEQVQVFVKGLKRPYGIAFYPPGPDPQWVYVGDTDAVLRFPYQAGDLTARGPKQHIADLPHGEGHSTRDIRFSADGKKMFVAVGSASNVDDPDTTPAEKNRADILEFNPDGSGMRVYAYGIRNAGGGLAIQPATGELWCSVNERDELGDNLVPDYITHVQDGGFYGWPWWYMGGHQDPRHKGKHPELQEKVITPDVILQPHNASLEITFYEGKQFPPEYQGDIFASEHGSWNKAVRVGYEVIRVPLHHTESASGEYEDFLTGFVVDDRHVWGRPVGVTVAMDGSLIVTDDGSNSIWRVSYIGK